MFIKNPDNNLYSQLLFYDSFKASEVGVLCLQDQKYNYILHIHYRASCSFMYATLPVLQRLTQLQAK